jgi:multidrug efflux pump subunit AcrA (membrane-fusion protein)
MLPSEDAYRHHRWTARVADGNEIPPSSCRGFLVSRTLAGEIVRMKFCMKRFVAASAVGLVMAAAHPAARAADDAKKTGAIVMVARATKACFSASIQITGFLVARREALVTLDAEGFRVTEILAQEGDKVTAGQALVRVTRQEGAAPGAGGPAASATAVLRAPAAGTVTRATAIVGATANPRADPLFRIAVDGEIELEAEVPSIHVPKLAAGQTARIESEDGRELSGSVRLVPAEINPMSQLGRVRLSIERDPTLRLGSFARATIDASRSCGVSVPKSAVLFRTEGTSVQVVRDRVVETRRVRVGFNSDLNVEIREGVREGEMVVANAGTSLRDGDQVQPKLVDEAGFAGER